MTKPNFKKLYYYGALLYAFLVPFHQQMATIAIIAWALLSVFTFTGNDIQKKAHLLFLPLLYLTYFIGIFTSDNPSFKFLESKFSFLVFPLIFFLHSYSKIERKEILKFFVYGLFGSIVICIGTALYNSVGFHEGVLRFRPNVLEGRGFMESVLYGGNYFFGSHLSIFHQTVYYALYLCAGVAVLLLVPKLFSEKLRWIFLFIFAVFIFLVSNKASFIALGLILVLKILTWKTKRNRKLIGVSLFSLGLLLFAFFNPRMKESAENIAEGKLMLNKKARYGFATRILSWDAAISLIIEKPILGYGHENAQTALNNRFEQKGYIYPLKESYNAHNLWLQIWLENGLLAALLLLSVFICLFRAQLEHIKSNPIFLSFILILLVNSMFEVLFNRFSGISFFSFLVCFTFSASKGGETEI